MAAGTAAAQWVDLDGHPVADADDRRTLAGFGAQLIFTADEQGLMDRWETPSAAVGIDTVADVAPGAPVSAFVIFAGCTPSAAGSCNVSMRLSVLKPDGTSYTRTGDLEVWNGPPPRARTLELSLQYLKVSLGAKDPRGPYTVLAEVTDLNAHRVLKLRKVFTATR